jgi:hypothetical protein
MDCVLLIQYIYYTAAARRRERTYALQAARRRRHHHHHHGHHHHGHTAHGQQQQRQQQEQQEPTAERGSSGSGGGGSGAEIEETAAQGGRKGKHGARGKAAAGLAAVAVAAVGAVALLQGPAASAIGGASHAPSLLNRSLSQSIASIATSVPSPLTHHNSNGDGDAAPPQWKETAGSALAYISCVLYLTSRVSQIVKNATRHSAEGLASSMFICAVAANTFFGSSILLRARTREEALSSLPWVLGSLGTVVLDLVILAQTGMIGRRRKRGGGGGSGSGADEEEPLLAGTSAGT